MGSNVVSMFGTIDVSAIVDGMQSAFTTLLPAVISIVAVKKVFHTIVGAIKGA